MQKVHERTVIIRTVTVACDDCGARSPAMAEETLRGHGWGLGHRDRCPACVKLALELAATRAAAAVQARHIAALAEGEPVLVRGRVVSGDTTLFDPAEVLVELDRAISAARKGRQ